ncbi:hypothetical protein BC628DRAFT_888276 [Trametes gibbosa]|nr:hypothetical protein BC628DRAFT_888276 [Trametes gibbosa]
MDGPSTIALRHTAGRSPDLGSAAPIAISYRRPHLIIIISFLLNAGTSLSESPPTVATRKSISHRNDIFVLPTQRCSPSLYLRQCTQNMSVAPTRYFADRRAVSLALSNVHGPGICPVHFESGDSSNDPSCTSLYGGSQVRKLSPPPVRTANVIPLSAIRRQPMRSLVIHPPLPSPAAAVISLLQPSSPLLLDSHLPSVHRLAPSHPAAVISPLLDVPVWHPVQIARRAEHPIA